MKMTLGREKTTKPIKLAQGAKIIIQNKDLSRLFVIDNLSFRVI